MTKDLEIHNLKEVISEFCEESSSTIALLIHVCIILTQSPITTVLPSTGKSYIFTLRFLNTKSPLTYSELDTCREICDFIVSVSDSLESYYPRDLRHRTYPAPSLSMFVEKIKNHCPALNYLYVYALSD
jgi:hypothetical protein